MEPPAPSNWIGCRHQQTFLMFIGQLISFAIMTNVPVGMVAMTSNDTNPNYPVFNWTIAERTSLTSSFLWSVLVTQIPAGILGPKYGPCKIMAFSMIFSGLMSSLLPVGAIYGGLISASVCRALQGLAQGLVVPCLNAHMAKWVIPQERRLMVFLLSGIQLGTILMWQCGGLLATSIGGWPSIFYTSGATAIIWGILCLYFGVDSPEEHRSISKEERQYIEGNLIGSSSDSKKMKIPWKDICTSIPVWALIIVNLMQNWGIWTLLTFIPTYIQKVHHFKIQTNGFLSSLPYVVLTLAGFLFAYINDFLYGKHLLSSNVLRKMWNSIAHYGGALALLMLAYFNTDATGAMALLTAAVALNAGTHCGMYINQLDLTPNFAGFLTGWIFGISFITSVMGPSVVGLIVTDESDVSQWQIVFLISAIVYAGGNTVFLIFGSTEIQPWNYQEVETKKQKEIESI